MKILLVAVNSKFIHSNLAVRYLKTFTKELDYQCAIREFSINDRVERVVEEIISEKPKVVAFSCYIWNIEFVIKTANLIKIIDSAIEILYGGPEVSYDSESFLRENSGDFVIQGEGEETYKEFIQYKLGLMDIKNIKGLYYKNDDNITFNGERPLMNLGQVIFPYESNDNLENKIVYYESSRGCPFMCKYCLSSTIHGVRFLEIERVKRELKFLIDKKVRLVKFVDRTFNCNDKFASSIWAYLISCDTETTFHFEISADILKKDQIEMLKTAPKGRFQFEIGVQTTNNEVLNNIDRFVNFESLKDKVMELRDIKNIHQHLDLIIGLPGENLTSFKTSFNDVYATKPEKLQIGFLKLLKGSAMREEADKWGMIYSPYPPYEILKSNDISYEEVIRLKKLEEVFEKYYNSDKFSLVLKYFEPKFITPFDLYDNLGNFFYEKGYMARSLSAADYLKVFIEFEEEFLGGDTSVIKQIIKYEFLKFNRKKWMPDFLPKDCLKSSKEVHIEKFTVDVETFERNGEINSGNFLVHFKL